MSDQQVKALVIVESPTKAKTIRKFLGSTYHVEASMGHVRDLPSSASEIPSAYKKKSWGRIGVNIDENFEPIYVVPQDKQKHIKELKALLKEVDELYIATDEDREGESIGWHLLEVLKPKVPVKRMVFHEITKDAIQTAINSPRELDTQLVQAQEARRVLDRLVGYIVSPILWKKIAPRLSAGRVQSAAVKILVERERERMRFKQATWYDLKGTFSLDNSDTSFEAILTHVNQQAIAQGSHFDPHTGLLKDHKRLHLSEELVQKFQRQAQGKTATVEKVERKTSQRSPSPPFITSTLQQEANRRWGWSATMTMRVAQRLYENGLITYMRTDSPSLAQEAIHGIRGCIKSTFGASFVPQKARAYHTKSKGAQEAHEAIRPAGTSMKTAQQLNLSDQDGRLYTLIWQRTMACQMPNADISHTHVHLKFTLDEHELSLRTVGKEIINPGFLKVYTVDDQKEQQLPSMTVNQEVNTQDLQAQTHHTKAIARYTEASLVKALESEGVGRPSTYASIIDTIRRRGYVRLNGRQLTPTFTAMAVTQLLEKSFSEIVDPEFTASMEGWLDQIATGGDQTEAIRNFYGNQLQQGLSSASELDPRQICSIHGSYFEGYEIRVGRYGPFIEFHDDDGTSHTISLPEDICPDEVTITWIQDKIQQSKEGQLPLGYDPETQQAIYVRDGRYGVYVQLGSDDPEQKIKAKRSSLPKGMKTEDLTIEFAQLLLSLPKVLGIHPESGDDIKLGLGRYGAYVQQGKTYASLPVDYSLTEVTLELAVMWLKEKLSVKNKEVQRSFTHPDGEEIEILKGRYGPYAKYGKINASLPKGSSIEEITLSEVLALLEAKQNAKASKKKATTKKATTKKATTKKATTKKATTKKATTKKATTKKATTKKATTKKATTKKADEN